MLKPSLILLLLCLYLSLHAQQEWVNWNSATGGLSFVTGQGILFTAVPQGLEYPDYMGQRAYSYNDPVTGKMRFLTDGRQIWNSSYMAILDPAKDSLISCDSDYYKVQIVPFSDDPSTFWLFHLSSVKGAVSQTEINATRGCVGSSGLYYSLLKMNFVNGTGALLNSNTRIIEQPLDRVGLIKHANNKDTWVIGHPWDSAFFSAFLATDNGVRPPVNTVIGPKSHVPWNNIRGCFAASADGKRIATSGSTPYVEIYDFNNATGELSNYRTISFFSEYVTSVCFSPDNSKLYIAVSDYKNCDDYSKIYQVDFAEADLAKSVFLLKRYPQKFLELSKGIDNRVWIKGASYPETPGSFFDVIAYPNQPKNACVIKEKFLKYGPQIYLPNIINNYIQQPPEQPVTKLDFPDTMRVCLGTTVLTAGGVYESYRWNTGDSAASISVDTPGFYTVLAGKKGFDQPEAYGYVYVKANSMEAFIAEDTIFCPKTPHELKVPGAISNILWSDGDTRRIKPVPAPGEYKLTGIDANGCRIWDSICVAIHYNPMVEFGSDTTICGGATLQLKMSPYADSTNLRAIKSSVFQWQDNSSKNVFTINQPGTYWGKITFDGCTVGDTLNVQYIPMPALELGADTTLCSGTPYRLQVPYVQGVQYAWSNGSTDTAVNVYASARYRVTAVNQFCRATDSALVVFTPNPTIHLGRDTVICKGTSLVLAPVPGAGYSYTWQNGDTTDSFIVTQPGIYSVQALDKGCITSGAIKVGVMQAPELQLTDTFFCKQQKLVLNTGVAATDAVKWQDGSAQHSYPVYYPGIYSVTATNKCGTDERTIAVKEQLCQVVMPSAFTPNNDGRNDVFRIKYPEIITTMQLVVFNRWGQQVFATTDPWKGWDGTVKGGPAGSGTYVWKMQYTDADNSSHALSGYVVLIR